MLAETICSAAAVAGLGIAGITAYRKRFLAAARIAAYALVPLGLVMTGAVEWIADTAFSPVAWAGFGVLGGAWLLLSSTRAVERRRGGRKEVAGGAEPGAVAPTASTPSRAVAPKPQTGKAGQSGAEDFSDIEAILKKHGI
ncbi:hypothetical protein [Streptomyces sp. NBC_00094]|uniref:hypothetical protein n=1 Tax=Streptomyces sp. NBC_00094 TaxID=2903620 RepID=UPI0022569E90|nr:hypothetical protein [Streptomyces sp. NBC_00094]MCX5389586.1 hypothetical protein [Streptomyces sp. NBC_00094]